MTDAPFKTLAQAKEYLETRDEQVAQLTKTVAAYESNESLAAAGIVRVDDPEKGVHFSVPRISELETNVSELMASLAKAQSETEALTGKLSESGNQNATLLKRVTELETSAKSVEARAREMLGNAGGAPLAVDAQDVQTLTASELRNRLATEKDPQVRSDTYWQLKELEAKEKSHKNGTK